MKLLGKIIVILVAALLVAGATLALDNSGALSSLTADEHGERGERPAGAPTDADGALMPGARPERGEFRDGDDGFGGEGGGGLTSNLMGMARNLGLIAAVVAGVWLLGWLSRQAATRRKLAQAEMPPGKEAIVLEEKDLT